MKNLFVGKLILFPVLFVFLKLLRNLEFVFIGELFLSNVTCLSEDFQVVRIETIVALEKHFVSFQYLFIFRKISRKGRDDYWFGTCREIETIIVLSVHLKFHGERFSR